MAQIEAYAAAGASEYRVFHRACTLIETVEDMVDVFGCYTGARVRYGKIDGIGVATGAAGAKQSRIKRNTPSFGSKLQRIAKQVDQHFLKGFFVETHHRPRQPVAETQRYGTVVGQRPENLYYIGKEVAKIAAAAHYLHLARFDLAEIHKLVHKSKK